MYDALILVNGEIPKKQLWGSLPYQLLICTDGAANTLKTLALTPDIIIGDMDSIAQGPQKATLDSLKLIFPQSHIIPITDQNTTDFEKALLFSEEKKMNQLLCVGLLGKSADHSVYNLSLLIRFGAHLKLLALSTHDDKCEWIFPLRARTLIHTEPECTLSFFGFPEAILTTQGLQWELNNTHLAQHKQHSVRNKTRQSTIQVETNGHCLAFLTAPMAPRIEYTPSSGLLG